MKQSTSLARRGAGEALAVAQGGWHSDVHQRYERFSVSRVVALPSVMLRVVATEEELAATAGTVRAAVAPTHPQAAAPAAPPQVPARSVPSPSRQPTRKRGRARVEPQNETERAAPPQQPVQLTPANCVGRHVLCPRDMWPSWACSEHGGTGWEAVIDKLGHDRETVQVRFVAQSSRTRQWRPMWLQLGSLRPI